MRFILNFIFFGLLFYVLWVYFPDAFKTLVNWAAAVVNYLQHFVQHIIDTTQASTTTVPPVAPPPTVIPPPVAP